MKKTKLNESIRIAKEGIGECWDDMADTTGQTPTAGEGPMTVTINMPGKNISVTTDSADEIANILKLAGIQVGGMSADTPAMPAEMPSVDSDVMYVGAVPADQVPGDVDGDGDHDMADHEAEEDDSEEETKEAVGDKSYTSKGGTVKQTPTGLTHQAGSGVYGGTETDAEEEARKKADDKAAKKELDEDDLDENAYNQAAAAASREGKEEFEFPVGSGKMHPAKMDQDTAHQMAETARILQLAGVTNEAQSAAQKAAFAKMIAAKGGNKSDDKSDKKDDNKKPDADGDGVPDYADKDKEVKEQAPATNSMFGQGVYEQSYARILELAGITESMDSSQRKRLDDLIGMYSDSVDPEDYYDSEYDDPEEVLSMIRSEFGDKIAQQVEAGNEKMHFPRKNQASGYDPLASRDSPRITKAGKMFGQDAKAMKSRVASRLGGHTTPNLPEATVFNQSYARILELAGLEESKLMNSPAGTSMDEPKVYDSLPSNKGDGKGNKSYGVNRADGQGENPMGVAESTVEQKFADAMGEYRKFVAESISRKK